MIPNFCFFEFSFRSPRRDFNIVLDGKISEWSQRFIVPEVMSLMGYKPFADVFFTWDEDCLYIAVNVKDKRKPISVNKSMFGETDQLELWLDMRNDKSLQRYNEHCHHFFFLPMGRGSNRNLATAGEFAEIGSTVQETIYDHPYIEVASFMRNDGYSLEAQIHYEAIPSYDPDRYPLIGFSYHINDSDGRSQWWPNDLHLSGQTNPSLWGTVILEW